MGLSSKFSVAVFSGLFFSGETRRNSFLRQNGRLEKGGPQEFPTGLGPGQPKAKTSIRSAVWANQSRRNNGN